VAEEKQVEVETTVLEGDSPQIDYYLAGILVLWVP